MSILKDLPELVENQIISQETSDKIQNYYQERKSHSGNKFLIISGILGASLIGLGIILIIAYNWDELSKPVKIVFAFLPLIIGQIICVYVLSKKKDSVQWRESSSVFLFFAVAACISLVSQIYNIQGNLSSFLLTWVLLCIPVVYVMNSAAVSLLCIAGITYYAVEDSYWTYASPESYIYWLLLLALLPYYFYLIKKRPEGNFTLFHNWFIALSVIITLGTVAQNFEELMFVAYMSLFGLYYLIGCTKFFKGRKGNAFIRLGFAGTIVLLFILSFTGFWEGIERKNFPFNEIFISPELIACVLLTVPAIILLYFQNRERLTFFENPFEIVFILFIVIFVTGTISVMAVVLVNLLIFWLGIQTLRKGISTDHLGILNFGLLIISALIICRFFNSDLSYLIRGILFVAVGIGFFMVNYLIIRKRRTIEQK